MTTAILRAETGQTWDVLACSIVFPLRGIWTVRGEADANDNETNAPNPLVAGLFELELAADNDGEPVVLAGTIDAADVRTWEGRAQFVMLGGLGSLAKAKLPSRTYQQAPFPTPILSICVDAISEAGEAFDDDVSRWPSELLEVPRWHRIGGRSPAQLLDRLAERFGFGWRMADDGLVSLGIEAWPGANVDDAGLYLTGPEDAVARRLEGTVARASLRPGTTLEDGRKIEEVVYELSENGLSIALRWGSGEGEGGLRGDHSALVARTLPPLAYRELHAATVRKRNSDGTLDAEADSETIGGLTGVPYRPGLVGCKLVPSDGDRLLLGFAAGDEAAPYAGAWMPDESASKGVARVGDRVNVGSLQFIAAPDGSGGIASVAITYTPASGAPTTVVVAPGPPVTIPLQGDIVTGSQEVFLRDDPPT